ncbi:hypothetical protein O3P69_015408 [Scylla paramamosain]|uniref:Uncharacterized protein n=1 Tax=Scylla paramamosain TaxID=85552 RepID=A0AAW0T7Y8_SCYPA
MRGGRRGTANKRRLAADREVIVVHRILRPTVTGCSLCDRHQQSKSCVSDTECQSPFVTVGGRCVHLDYTVAGSWEDMRQYCQELGGDLINLAGLQFYGDLILYMNNLSEFITGNCCRCLTHLSEDINAVIDFHKLYIIVKQFSLRQGKSCSIFPPQICQRFTSRSAP